MRNMPKETPPSEPVTYDITIIGAGLAGLSLTAALLRNPATSHKRILLIDNSPEGYAPRTWCFWERENGPWQHLIEKDWPIAEFFEGKGHLLKDLSPYRYKMISSERFREHVWQEIRNAKNVVFVKADVQHCAEKGACVHVHTDGGSFCSNLLFDSRFDIDALKTYEGHVLLQQFVGHYIETTDPVFDVDTARLMDFRAPQQGAVAFYYVLPLSAHRALVEYTLFTKEAVASTEFENRLHTYLNEHFGHSHYRITSSEEGIIPMTDYPFAQGSKRIIPIGTAGGCSKASSGYTFTFVQQQTAHIIGQLNAGRAPLPYPAIQPARFRYYDSILLRLISRYPERGAGIFFSLFAQNPAADVLRFLDNTSNLAQEFHIFRKLPIALFTRMAWRELVSKL